jgi:hypothetical protein
MRAVKVAHADSVPFVWVDDPDGLFPLADRPTLLNRLGVFAI